jgi:hypothetical protein
MRASMPAVKRRKSVSMPSEKMTPDSGMRERTISGCSASTGPNTSEACELRLGNGSRTANRSQRVSQGSGSYSGKFFPLPRAVATASDPVTTLFIQAVEPSPVHTINPEDDCISLRPP